MIRVSDHPKKRFNISNKFALYQKQINKQKHDKHHVFSNLDLNYTKHIDQLKEELNNVKKQYDDLVNNDLENKKDLIKELEAKIEKQNKELAELIDLSDKNLHDNQVNIQNVKYSAKTIRLGFLYKIDKLWIKILLTSLFGIVGSISTWLFVQYTGVYTAGLSGVIQGIAKITKLEIEQMGPDYISLSNLIYNVLFWTLYLFINIPLLIFAFFKLGKQFALLSSVYIIVGQIVGFGLGFINNGQGIFIFTKMNPSVLDNLSLPKEYISGIQMLPWNTGQGIIIGLFIYSLTNSIINGISYSAIYILGASTGGNDIIGFYYSKVKNKSIANLLTIFNVSSLLIGVTLGSFACWMIKSQTPEYIDKINLDSTTILGALFSPNLIASIVGSIVSGILYNYYFPRNKVIKVQVYSEKTSEIALTLAASNWNYNLLLSSNKDDVLTNKNSNLSLETICLYIDIPILISAIRSIDSEGLITIYSTFGFDGELPTSSYER